MNVPIGAAPQEYTRSTFEGILSQIRNAFARIANQPRLEASVALNFAAPGAVPGVSDLTVTMDGAEFGDTVLVGCSITAPAGFMPPVGFVSAANVVTVRWFQFSGAAANPDGAGATYQIDVGRH